MIIDPIELAQYEASWLAYGKRRASRLRWKKTTNADVAVGLDVQAITKKIEAHDKRLGFVRWIIRRFTKIERDRELLVYRLGSDVLKALKASSTTATLKAQQPNLDKIISVTARASWFSWFKKPLNAFMGWVGQKKAELELPNQHNAQPNPAADAIRQPIPTVVLPVVLDTEAALQCFREKVTADKRAIAVVYSQCEASFYSLYNMTAAEKAEKFNACFEPFKKKLRELQLYYHPDKALATRATAAGLKHETFAVQVAIAFKEIIKPAYEAVVVKRDKIKDSIEKNMEIDRILADAAEITRQIKEADLAFWIKADELRESDARQDEQLKTNAEALAELGKIVERVDIAEIALQRELEELKSSMSSQLSELKSELNEMFESVMAAALAANDTFPTMSAPSEEPRPNKQPVDGGVTPLTSPMLSTFPALFAVKPSSGACGKQHSAVNVNSADGAPLERMVPTCN